MTPEPIALPVPRTWREIPQQVKTRAMSAEGRRRVVFGALRFSLGALALCGAVIGAWEMARVLRTNAAPAPVRRDPIGDHIQAVTNGVLDRAWICRTLALPAGATLETIDPSQLRARLMAGGQVAAVDVIRHFPHTLEVQLTERMPVARLMADTGPGGIKPYIVARDGVVYEGIGYDPAMVATLPWLDGVKPVPGRPGLARIAGMEEAADFLAQSKLDAEHLYRTWQVVSLARLQLDGLIEVRTAAGTRIVFSARGEDLFSQLARLDALLDGPLHNLPPSGVGEIDLSLGMRVTVAPAAAPPVHTSLSP